MTTAHSLPATAQSPITQSPITQSPLTQSPIATKPSSDDRRGRRRTLRHVAPAGALAAATGGVLLYGYGQVVASMSVPMAAGEPWAASAQAVTPANFAFGTVLCTFWGTVIAVLLGRFGSRPARTFVRTTTVLAALSLVFPLAAAHTAPSTRVALALGHLIAAAVVIPVLTRALRRSAPTR